MATVLAIVFAITTVFCAIMWFLGWLSCRVLVMYMLDKGYDKPNGDETNNYTRRALKKMLSLK